MTRDAIELHVMLCESTHIKEGERLTIWVNNELAAISEKNSQFTNTEISLEFLRVINREVE